MKFWIASSTILLCVLGFFVYVINIILKQKRLSEIKTDFINNMTHELKTPISTIGLSSEVLLQKDVALNPERIKNYAQIIKSENQRLQTQVERVLQMARLETEEIQLSKKDCDIHELIEVAVPSIELNFRDVALSIETRLSAEMSTIFGDEMHITNIIYNLLDNAAKYSGDAPKILIETSSDKTGVTIAVEDNGKGIPKEYRKMVFEKFFRIPTGNVHDVKGFGIGLHYVKSITRAHRGSVKITNGSGTGARFEVRIPYGTEFD